ncbi:MAG: hypothetical protein IT308_09595 [Anaerolineaceae bacterium]|nr:hypothetical protein [Anaerolineaceae bacterium]
MRNLLTSCMWGNDLTQPRRLRDFIQVFFCFSDRPSYIRFARILLVTFYLGGLALWGWFLNWGIIPLDFHDWSEITAPRLAFLKDAVTQGALPLHMPEPRALLLVTDRFMAVPDVILSPQVLLLRFMSIGSFSLAQVCLLYSAGFAGLLWLRRRFQLSPAAFVFLFLLFNFNGHIVAHISIGHLTWGGYFLLPWFVILVYRLLEGDSSWVWVLQMAGLLFVLLLQGTFHQFVWHLGFLAVLGLTCWRTLPGVIKAGFASVVLSAVRLLPPALLVQAVDNEFQGGFPSLSYLWQGFTVLHPPGGQVPALFSGRMLGWWEIDYYIGLAGLGFVLCFAAFSLLPRRSQKSGENVPLFHFRPLLIPVLVFLIFSYGGVFQIFSGTVLAKSERVPARLASLAVVFLLIQAVVAFQWLLNRLRRFPWPAGLSLPCLFWLGFDLWRHFKTWQVTAAFAAFTPERAPLHLGIVANYPDSAYFTLLERGLAVSILAMIVLAALALYERHKRQAGIG